MVIGGCGSCPTRLFKGRLGRGRRRPNKRIKDAKQAGERAPNELIKDANKLKKVCQASRKRFEKPILQLPGFHVRITHGYFCKGRLNMVYNIKKQCFTVLCNRALLFSARSAPFSVSSLPSRPPISNV